MLPEVDFCGLRFTRLIIGANPFGGFSHQNPARDEEMRTWHTPERIRETWSRAYAAGIATMVTNNETPHVIDTVRQYIKEGGPLQWIAQMNPRPYRCMEEAIDDAVSIGAKAGFVHGGYVDKFYERRDGDTLSSWVEYAKSVGLPIGVAGHAPEVHDWVNSLNIVDFHVVCFFNCGSVHNGAGEKFRLSDAVAAAACCQRIAKPCIGYKIMGAGRIDPRMAFEHAFENIKSGDVVNVGMHRGDKDNMVEENAELVRDILSK